MNACIDCGMPVLPKAQRCKDCQSRHRKASKADWYQQNKARLNAKPRKRAGYMRSYWRAYPEKYEQHKQRVAKGKK